MTPEEAVDAVNGRFGRHPGSRALHAKGTVCRGTFTASSEAAALTRAAPLQGGPVEATVRFSNGAGDPGQPDHAVDVRGLAVKLAAGGGAELDILAQTSPNFPARTAEGFIEFVRANQPGAAKLWRLPWFIARNRHVVPGLRASLESVKPPPSYATCEYFAIHAFRWVAAGGEARWVRYTWVPETSEPRLSARDARARGADYLQDDLGDRLARAPFRFALRLQVAGAGDPTDDPTAAWPADRETVTAGTLEVTDLAPELEGPDRLLVFDPAHLVDGIEASGDPVLAFRPRAYSVSIERRTAKPGAG